MPEAVCAGHLCIDLTPQFSLSESASRRVFNPGRLSEVGALECTLGGTVGNTGIALDRLGFDTALMARTGDDAAGRMTLDALNQKGVSTQYIHVVPGETASYSIVLAVPGSDRVILHNPGANNTFTMDDVDFETVEKARLFHFGYPPIMRRMFENNARALADLLRAVKDLGVTVSLDTAFPSEEAKLADWKAICANALPYADIFAPSIEEMLMLIYPEDYEKLMAQGEEDILEHLDIDDLERVASDCLSMGAKVVVLKCGTLGYYAKTASAQKISQMGKAAPEDPGAWADREVFSGIFCVDKVVSATGAGDTSIAGFLGALLRGFSLEDSVTMACAAGAVCVTSVGGADAFIPFDELWHRVRDGWEKRPVRYAGSRLVYDEKTCTYVRRP